MSIRLKIKTFIFYVKCHGQGRTTTVLTYGMKKQMRFPCRICIKCQ